MLYEISLQQNEIAKLNKDQIKNLEKEKNKYEAPTPIPIPSVVTEGLDCLLEQLIRLGSIQDTAGLYINKTNPVRSIGKPGSKKGELNGPLGLALDGEKIFVADNNNSRIQIFSMEGKFIQEFGKGKLINPHSIAISDEWVFVSDWGSS